MLLLPVMPLELTILFCIVLNTVFNPTR